MSEPGTSSPNPQNNGKEHNSKEKQDGNQAMITQQKKNSSGMKKNSSLVSDIAKHIQEEGNTQIQNNSQIKGQISNECDDIINTQDVQNNSQQKQNIKDDITIVQEQTEKYVVKIQSIFRKQKAARYYQKHIRKRARYRMNVLNELIQTEKAYVDKLKALNQYIKIPLLEIIGKQQVDQIFSSLDTIIQLNTQFYEAIHKRYNSEQFKKFNNPSFGFYSTIIDISVKMFPFFKMYGEFLNNYENSQRVINKLKDENVEFEEFLENAERKPNVFNQDIASLMILPVLRLPKYALLFKEIQKNMDKDHPDYNNVVKAIQVSENVNEHNNQRLKQIIQNRKKIELQNLFGSENVQILNDQRRQYLDEDTCLFFHNQEVKSVVIYFLTDMLLITERTDTKMKIHIHGGNHQEEESFKLVSYLYLNELSFVKNVPDSKYFKYLFRVNGKNDCLTFFAQDEEDKTQKMKQIQDIINEIKVQKKKSGGFTLHPIQVTVLGTEQRNNTTLDKFTVYIVEIMIADIQQKIFVRYSEMVEFEKKIKKYWKNLQVPHLRTYNFFTPHKTKTIEQRKLVIENFIQKVLQQEEIIKRLPKQFYELPDNIQRLQQEDNVQQLLQSSNNERGNSEDYDSNNKGNSIGSNSDGEHTSKSNTNVNASTRQPSITQTPERRQTFSYQPCSAQQILAIQKQKEGSQKRYNSERLSEVFSFTENKTFTIEIDCLDNNKVQCVITPSSRCFEVVQQIAQSIKLQNFLDFRLFLVDEQKNVRVLDDDELIWKIIVPKSTEQKKNFLQKFGQTLGLKKEEKLSLIFKKYLWLDQELEEVDYRQDLVRLKLLRCQIFEDIRTLKHQLDFRQYSLFAALNIYINYPNVVKDMVASRKSLSDQQIKQGGNDLQRMILLDRAKTLLPSIIFSANNNDNWVENISSYIYSISKELDKIARENKDNQGEELPILEEEQRESQQSAEECKQIYTEKQMLAEMVVINSIKQHHLFGVTIFSVQTYKQTLKLAQQNGIELLNNIWLGIKYDSILILKPYNKEQMRKYDLNQIENTEVHPQSIIFKFSNEKISFRFNTFFSYEISQLITEYKEIRKECIRIQKEEQEIISKMSQQQEQQESQLNQQHQSKEEIKESQKQ